MARARRTTSSRYAYPTSGSAARQRQETVNSPGAPRFEVIPGGRSHGQSRGIAADVSPLAMLAAAVAVILLILAVSSFIRIAFTSASVTTGIERQAASAQLAQERSVAGALEVQNAQLSNTTRVMDAADGMGMSAPADAEAIYLEPDVVVVDESGQLSLAQSVRRAGEQAAEG